MDVAARADSRACDPRHRHPQTENVETRMRLYHMMYLIRRTEELLMLHYHPADEMRCPIHFCVGQEAMPAALTSLLRPSDVMMSHYRSHGYYL
jgi:TPP-dependent pyruvate/acetoin dehydrogenase alpha subunit